MQLRGLRIAQGPNRTELLTTALLGLVGVIVFFFFLPAGSDVYWVWSRGADLIEGGVFGAGQLEYPPLGSAYMDALSRLPTSESAVVLNGLIMTACAVMITWLLARSEGVARSHLRYWAFSPSLVLFLPINFDTAAVLMTVLAIVAVSAGNTGRAGLWTGVGFLTKIFPGALVPPFLVLIRSAKGRLAFLIAGGASVIVGYAIFAVAFPSTWLLHLEFASDRDDFWTTPWRIVEVFTDSPDTLGHVVGIGSVVCLVAGLVGTTIWAYRKQPSAAAVSLVAVALFLLANRVFKPQYILWVLPLYALGGGRVRWLRLLEYSAIVELGAYYLPLPRETYLVTLIARTVALVAMIVVTVRAERSESSPQRVQSPPA